MENFMDFTTGDIVAINVHALYYAFGLRLSNTEVNVTPKNRIGVHLCKAEVLI